MKKSFRILIVLEIIMLTISCSKSDNYNNTEKKKIAIVLKMNGGYQWGEIKMGADAAAREFNVDIECSAPNSEENIQEQINLVNEAIEKKPGAIILSPSDYNSSVSVTEKAYEMGIPIIIIDSKVNTNKINSYISTNNIEAGEKAGNMIVDFAGENAKVAILSFVKGTRNAEEREEGVEKVISKYPNIKVVAKEYCSSDTKLAYDLTKKIISQNKEIDTIVALNYICAEGSAQAIDEMNLAGKVKIIAFDNTVQEINYLEKGVIQAIVIQNPFNIGYLSVKNAVEVMERKKIDKCIYIDSKVVSKDNMYLPENQKLLFPFIK